MTDQVRLQTTLDEIAEMVAWAIEWIDEMREVEPDEDLSDMPALRAELARLRVVADGLEPTRIRDAVTGQRFYLAPDDAARRTRELERSLDIADKATAEAYESQQRARDDRERSRKERSESRAKDEARDIERRELVLSFLREHGPSTVAQLAAGTGLERFAAEWAAKQVAKRRRDRRFELTESV
jgi:hypothetical protein